MAEAREGSTTESAGSESGAAGEIGPETGPETGPAAEGGHRSPLRAVATTVREIALVVAVAMVVSLVVKTFLLQAFFIPSPSMEQTLDIGDRVVVSKLTPGPFELHRGDVAVFSDPGNWLDDSPPVRRGPVGSVVADALTFVGLLPEDSDDHLIKRIIGLPGDQVVCCDADGLLTVNGVPVEETGYLAAGVAPSEERFEVTVPDGMLWVMGDNRPNSADSRAHPDAPYDGFVPVDHVTGRAVAIVWPAEHWTWLGTPSVFDDVGGVPGVS